MELSSDEYIDIMNKSKISNSAMDNLKKIMRDYQLDRFVFPAPMFEHFDQSLKVMINDEKKWTTFKCLDDTGNISNDFSKICTKYGGIYTFFVKSPIIPFQHKFIIYIGMASKSPSQNLRKEVGLYKKFIGATQNYDRDTVGEYFYNFKEYLYCGYYPLDKTKNEILDIETALINHIVPVCNPDQNGTINIAKATRAFLR